MYDIALKCRKERKKRNKKGKPVLLWYSVLAFYLSNVNYVIKCLWLQVVSYNCLPDSNFNSIEVVDEYNVHWALTETLGSEVFHSVILSIFAYVLSKDCISCSGTSLNCLLHIDLKNADDFFHSLSNTYLLMELEWPHIALVKNIWLFPEIHLF